MKRVVILGGGVGGAIVAKPRGEKIRRDEAEVVLVDRTGHHVYQPGFVYVAFEKLKPATLVRSERKLLRKRVRLVLGGGVRIDPEGREGDLAGGGRLPARLLLHEEGDAGPGGHPLPLAPLAGLPPRERERRGRGDVQGTQHPIDDLLQRGVNRPRTEDRHVDRGRNGPL